MAGKAIDLEFTVAKAASSGNIIDGLTAITAEANKNPAVTGIRFKLADNGSALRGELEGALRGISDDLSKAFSKSLGKSTASSSNIFKGMQGDLAKTTAAVSALNKVTMTTGNSADTIRHLAQTLGSMKVDSSGIQRVTKDLDEMSVRVSKISTSIQGKSLKVNVSGIDELGRAVTVIKQYDLEAGEITSVGKTIAQSFDTSAAGAKRFQQEVNAAFTEMRSLQSKIGSQEIKIAKIDPKNTAELQRETAYLDELKTKYADLQGTFSSYFTQKQQARLDLDTKAAENKLQAVLEQLERTREATANQIKLDIDLGTTETSIRTLQKRFESLGNIPDEVKNKFTELQSLMSQLKETGDPQIRASAYQQINDILSALQKNYKAAADAAGDFGKSVDASTAQAAAGNLMDRMTASLNDYSAGALLARGEVKELIVQLQGLQSAGNTDRLVDGVKRIGAAFDDVQKRAAGFQTAFQKFTSKISTGLKQALGISTVGMAARKAVQEAKKMYKEVLDIDTAMTGLYKVTDETSERYDQFLKSTSKNAQKLGSTISGLIDQSATWAKLGYSMDESEQLAQISSIYAHVGEVDNETAVSDLITSMKAFNITAEESVTIVDRLNELGNNYAVSSAGLGAALARSASSLKLAGTDIDKALAMVTGGSEITQKPAEFGNFLKIAVMRIRGMKGELEELGEDVDQTVDSVSKVQTQILNRTHGKVNIFGDDGEFRDYYEIMKEISEVWDELNSKDRASLSEILFGKVRSNQGAALIQAFQSGQVEKALNTSLNSQGSAMKEYERWMQSLEAKTNQFKAAYQNLAQTVLNSDFLKGAVDTGTNFLNVLTKIIDKIGIIPTLLGAGGALFGITHIGKHHCPAWA